MRNSETPIANHPLITVGRHSFGIGKTAMQASAPGDTCTSNEFGRKIPPAKKIIPRKKATDDIF